MKRKERNTFYDVIEKNIDPDQPRARELRIQAFGQAQTFLEDLIDSESKGEHLDDLIYETNIESGAFAENFTRDLDRIVELGIKALKWELEKEIGAFEFEQRENKKDDE